MPKVIFIKSPSCKPFYLAYHIGDEAEIEDKDLAIQLIQAGFAKPVTTTKVEKAVAKTPKKETRKAAKPKATAKPKK